MHIHAHHWSLLITLLITIIIKAPVIVHAQVAGGGDFDIPRVDPGFDIPIGNPPTFYSDFSTIVAGEVFNISWGWTGLGTISVNTTGKGLIVDLCAIRSAARGDSLPLLRILNDSAFDVVASASIQWTPEVDLDLDRGRIYVINATIGTRYTGQISSTNFTIGKPINGYGKLLSTYDNGKVPINPPNPSFPNNLTSGIDSFPTCFTGCKVLDSARTACSSTSGATIDAKCLCTSLHSNATNFNTTSRVIEACPLDVTKAIPCTQLDFVVARNFYLSRCFQNLKFFQDTLKPTSPTSSTPLPSGSAPPGISEPGKGLSTAAKAGIGVGASIGGFLIIGFIAFVVFRRKKNGLHDRGFGDGTNVIPKHELDAEDILRPRAELSGGEKAEAVELDAQKHIKSSVEPS